MASKRSVDQIVAQLETKIAHHRERHAFHSEQEALHRDQMSLHAAELDTAVAHLEAFRAASRAADELLDRDKSTAPPPAEQDDDIVVSRGRALSRMILRVLEGKAPDETFGAQAVTREIQARWGAKLRRRPDPRSVAANLRRWAAAGRIHQVREGRSHYESLYRKVPAQ